MCYSNLDLLALDAGAIAVLLILFVGSMFMVKQLSKNGSVDH